MLTYLAIIVQYMLASDTQGETQQLPRSDALLYRREGEDFRAFPTSKYATTPLHG